MANIIDVYELDSSNNTKQIYRFGSTNHDDMGKSQHNITHVDDTIHHDDSISTVKFKIFNALGRTTSVEEMYLFFQKSQKINPRQLYTNITQDDDYSLDSVPLCSSFKNINREISCDYGDTYEYDFILDNIDSSLVYPDVQTPIGVKCVIKKKYPFVANPFLCDIVDRKIEREDSNIIQTTNSNLLFQYDSDITKIYLCKARDVFTRDSDVPLNYMSKIYFPLLFREDIVSIETLNEKKPEIIIKNVQQIQNSNFDIYNSKIDLFYNMFYTKKNDLKYLSSGITSIDFTIHPLNSDIFPIEILFKLIQSTELLPFIKFNPGNKREIIYRLFTVVNISDNVKKIPILYK